MNEYYHQHITDRSWQILQELAREYTFILIGGWAVFLYTHSLKSKDIDIVVGLEELGKLKSGFEMIKNDRLAKYEIRQGEVDIDVYAEHYSNPGIPAEDIRARTRVFEGFTVPKIEALLLLKHNAWRERRGSAKGRKDELDLLSLLMQGADVNAYRQLLSEYRRGEWLEDIRFLIQSRTDVPELDLNDHQYSRLKKDLLDSWGKE